MRVVDIMTPNPYCVTTFQPLFVAAALMRDHDIGMVPIVDDDRRPIGVITDRDIAIRHVASCHHNDCVCRETMTSNSPLTVRPTDDVGVVMRLMRQDAVRRVLVTEPHGRLVGVVATADLLRHADQLGEHEVTAVLRGVSEPVMIER